MLSTIFGGVFSGTGGSIFSETGGSVSSGTGIAAGEVTATICSIDIGVLKYFTPIPFFSVLTAFISTNLVM